MDKSLEKLHTDATGVPGPRPGSGRVWLNTVEVVNALIRDFTAELLNEIGRQGDLMAWLVFEATRMNNLFLGITESDLFDIGPWNRPDQCGIFVANALTLDCELRLAVRDAFMAYAAKVLAVYRESGGEFDEVQRRRLFDLSEQLKNALLGLTGTVSPETGS